MKSAMMAKGPDKNIVSGNSRVKVTIYGQVNKALRISSSGGETQVQTVDNDASSSRLGIRATGSINKNLSIGALHELEWQINPRSGTSDANDGKFRSGSKDDVNQGGDATGNQRLRARHVDLWLSHKDLGKLSIGQGSIAGDASHFISMSGIGNTFHFGGPTGADGTAGAHYIFLGFFGARQSRIRYDTPNLMGLSFAASLNQNQGWSIQGQYAGAPPGVKNFNTFVRAGYREDDGGKTYWAMSGGVSHSSGFNLSASYASDQTPGDDGEDPFQWGVEVGWTGKLSDIGSTSLGVGYGYSDEDLMEVQYYYAGVNQNVDAAAADVYAGAATDSGTDDMGNDRDSVTVVVAGVRIKF